MKNHQGMAPIFVILVLAALAAVSFGAYSLIVSNGGGLLQKSVKLTANQKKEIELVAADTQELAAIIEAAQGLGLDSDIMDAMVDSVVAERKAQVKQAADKILAKNTCDALMIDIDQALQLASDAWLATDGETGDALWAWAREAFRGYVVDASLAVGATFLEQDVDLFAMSYEARKTLYAQAREKFYDRALLAQQAQLFGFEDLHAKILAGEFLEPICVQLWNITAEIEYNSADDYNCVRDHWIISADLPDVPIYKYHPKMGLSEISERVSQKGNLEIIEMWWQEAPDSPSRTYFTKENDPWWTISVNYEANLDDFWQDELIIEGKIDISKPRVSVCSDYFGCGALRASDFYGNIKMNIPTLKFWQREPFYYEQDRDKKDLDDTFNEQVTSRVKFYPTKRVKITEL